MKLNGKLLTKVRFICLLMSLLTVLVSCAGLSDWEYKLPNLYQIIRVNSEMIVLEQYNKEYDLYDIVINGYIFEFCYNDTFVGVKKLPGYIYPDNSDINVMKADRSDYECYLVNTANDSIYGPYDLETYNEAIENLNVGEMCDWINTEHGKPNKTG